MTDESIRPMFRDAFPIFTVRDLAASLAFFTTAIGYAETYRWPADAGDADAAFVSLRLGSSELGLGRGETIPRSEQATQLAIETDDVEIAFAWAVAHGATGVVPPAGQPMGEVWAFIDDPSGLPVMLWAKQPTG